MGRRGVASQTPGSDGRQAPTKPGVDAPHQGTGGKRRRKRVRANDMPVPEYERFAGGHERPSRSLQMVMDSMNAPRAGATLRIPRGILDTGKERGPHSAEAVEVKQRANLTKPLEPGESLRAFRKRLREATRSTLIENARTNSKTRERRKEYLRSKKERSKRKRADQVSSGDESVDSETEVRPARPTRAITVGLGEQADRPPSLTAFPKKRNTGQAM